MTKKEEKLENIIPKDYKEHKNYNENNILHEEYIMHTQRTLPTSYLYFERSKKQCSNCKYSEFNKPRTSKGTGWYKCRLGLNSRIKRYCYNYQEKKEYSKLIKPLE